MNPIISKGVDMAVEYIRQKCIYNNLISEEYTDKSWWEYTSRLPDKCNSEEFSKCSKDIHNEINLNSKFTET